MTIFGEYAGVYMNRGYYKNILKFKVLDRIREMPSNVVLRENIEDLGSPPQISRCFKTLVDMGELIKIGYGIYAKAYVSEYINKPVIKIGLKSDIDWFDLEIDISFGNQKASMKELQKAFLKKSNYVTLGDGSLGILPEEWMKKFANYFKSGEIKKNGIQLSNYQFGIIDELYEEIDVKPAFLEELYNKKLRLQNITDIETVGVPKGIKAKLRDYQQHGLNWPEKVYFL